MTLYVCVVGSIVYSYGRQRNSQNCCIDSNNILLSDINQQVHVCYTCCCSTNRPNGVWALIFLWRIISTKNGAWSKRRQGQGRLLIIRCSLSTVYHCTSVGSTAERKQADFIETLGKTTTTPLHRSSNMKRLCRFLPRDAMLAWYMPSSCVCVCVLSVCQNG